MQALQHTMEGECQRSLSMPPPSQHDTHVKMCLLFLLLSCRGTLQQGK